MDACAGSFKVMLACGDGYAHRWACYSMMMMMMMMMVMRIPHDVVEPV